MSSAWKYQTLAASGVLINCTAARYWKGSMINGYRIVRIKLFKPRDEKTNETLKQMQDEITALSETIAAMKKNWKINSSVARERFSCKDQLLQAEDDLKNQRLGTSHFIIQTGKTNHKLCWPDSQAGSRIFHPKNIRRPVICFSI